MRTKVSQALALVGITLLLTGIAQQRGCSLPDWPIVIPEIVVPKVESVHAVLIRESADQEPWLGSLIVQLRNADLGPHVLDVLDDDQLPPGIKAIAGTGTLPMLVLIDRKSDKLIKTLPVTSTDTVATVKAAIAEITK